MPELVESVQPSEIPPTLVLRLAAGRAYELIRLMRVGKYPSGDLEVFEEAARALRLFARASSPNEARSIQQATDQAELLLSAIRALRGITGQELEAVLETLSAAADDLDDLAEGLNIEESRLEEISNLLSVVRGVAATMRASVPEVLSL